MEIGDVATKENMPGIPVVLFLFVINYFAAYVGTQKRRKGNTSVGEEHLPGAGDMGRRQLANHNAHPRASVPVAPGGGALPPAL